MADAWGRLTGQCGIALVTGGPGFTNAAAALYTALAAESPMVLLSGHAAAEGGGTRRLPGAAPGRDGGARRQGLVDGASPPRRSAHDIAEAVRIAMSGRRGPVHLSLPSDLLDEKVADAPALRGRRPRRSRRGAAARATVAADAHLRRAGRGRAAADPGRAAAVRRRRSVAARAPRGGDGRARRRHGGPARPQRCTLGAFAEVLRRADLIVLLGKAHDFALRFGNAPVIDPACRFIVIDPEAALIAARRGGQGRAAGLERHRGCRARARRALHRPARAGAGAPRAWRDEVRAAVGYRPPAWATLASPRAGQGASARNLPRARRPSSTRDPSAILICEGGEIGQWPQACSSPTRRIINGPAGSIGAAIPFAIAARAADPDGARRSP